MNIKKVTFKTDDNAILEGMIYLPDNATKDVIIAVHGMTSNCLKHKDDVIAKYATANNIAYMCFNNRGHDVVSYTQFKTKVTKSKLLNGTAYENVLDSYYDVKGAIDKVIELGYENINLQGHSLGCTKIVYTYNRLLKENSNLVSKIKSVILLSLIDIPNVLKIFLGENYEMMLDYTKQKITENKKMELMPLQSFIHPISVKTYYQYLVDNKEINFAQYGNKDFSFDELNNIKANLFMRWGTVNELIAQKPQDLIDELRNKVKSNENRKVDIDYVLNADHSYHGKEEVIANDIVNFIK